MDVAPIPMAAMGPAANMSVGEITEATVIPREIESKATCTLAATWSLQEAACNNSVTLL